MAQKLLHDYWLKARGGSFRKNAFVELFDPDTTGMNLETVGVLIPEPTNKFDPFAIQVRIEGEHLAYLPKELAKLVHAEVTAEGEMAVPVRVVGGFIKHDGERADFGIHIAAPAAWAELMQSGALIKDTDKGPKSVSVVELFGDVI